ncbi:MAG TPA: DUF2752 domain-containing protein [Acidimicrobiales bacterium]|nr:DUF2752 domain-containing protein [Acidimicrobiales bacterium]
MPSAAVADSGLGRAQAAVLTVGAVAGCAVLAALDPSEGGPYPSCPTQVLLGLDCPACGTLRGGHALLRGRLGQSLDHNLLLVVAVPVAVVAWVVLAARALGRPVAAPRLPRWAVPAAIAVAAVFTVVRNLDLGPLAWLDSAA